MTICAILQVLRDFCKLKKRKHYGDDDGPDQRSDEDDDKWFQGAHQVGDETLELFGVVDSHLLYILPDGTGFFPDTDHVNQILGKEAVAEDRLLIVSDSQPHGATELDTCLHLIFYTDDILFELDIRYDIGSGF